SVRWGVRPAGGSLGQPPPLQMMSPGAPTPSLHAASHLAEGDHGLAGSPQPGVLSWSTVYPKI
ncbi:hypothetical protein CRG98_012696, partial [Punica granatum]